MQGGAGCHNGLRCHPPQVGENGGVTPVSPHKRGEWGLCIPTQIDYIMPRGLVAGLIRKIGTAVASSQERRRLTPHALTLVSRQQRA
jgi:hypothetical protein